MDDFRQCSQQLVDLLGLAAEPVAVFLLDSDADTAAFADWEPLHRHRYCQALMRARRGGKVLLSGDELACPAAAAAFGFRPLPPKLASGEGLVGFGIVREPGVARTMFDRMPRLEPGTLARIALSPLSAAPRRPDVVVVEDRPERLMWLLLADLNRAGGTRRVSDSAVLQATCVDSTVIPFQEQRLNFCLGCYGCREATDLWPAECVLGFPGAMLAPLVELVEFFSQRALPRSRGKRAYEALGGQETAAAAEGEPGEEPAAGLPGAAAHHAPRVMPRLDRDLQIALSPGDVISIYRIAMDNDPAEALEFVTNRLDRVVRHELQKPH